MPKQTIRDSLYSSSDPMLMSDLLVLMKDRGIPPEQVEVEYPMHVRLETDAEYAKRLAREEANREGGVSRLRALADQLGYSISKKGSFDA